MISFLLDLLQERFTQREMTNDPSQNEVKDRRWTLDSVDRLGVVVKWFNIPRDPVVPNLRFGTTGASWHLHNRVSNHLLRRYLDP